jgi:hypothetical protein
MRTLFALTESSRVLRTLRDIYHTHSVSRSGKSNFPPIVVVDGGARSGTFRSEIKTSSTGKLRDGGRRRAWLLPYVRRARSPRQRVPPPQLFSSPVVILFAPSRQASSPPARQTYPQPPAPLPHMLA